MKEVVYSGRTKYQLVDIIDTFDFGRMLILDKYVQSSTRDEFIYHEALVHPAMLAHPDPEQVLIIGGGEGATLREVLRHPSVEKVFMVDIDGEVVELSKRYLSEMHQGSFNDPRVELVIADGRSFLEGARQSFDVIIVDATDPIRGGPSCSLYTIEFYSLAKERLRPRGILVTQATSPWYYRDCFLSIRKTVASVFDLVSAYQVWIPSYDTIWAFVTGSSELDPKRLRPEEVAEAIERRGLKLKFYGPEIHYALFALPKDLLSDIEGGKGRIIRDAEPYAIPRVT